jgi:hypothetical protein
MMKGAVFIFAMAMLALAAVVSIATIQDLNEKPAIVNITSVSTDKDVYHSKERMEINISIFSSKVQDGYHVTVVGIMDSRGNLRLAEEQSVNLTEGENNVIFRYDLPICSRCAGLKAGDYFINVSVIDNRSIVANASHTIYIA